MKIPNLVLPSIDAWIQLKFTKLNAFLETHFVLGS